MNTCKTCKWWGKWEGDGIGAPKGWATCGHQAVSLDGDQIRCYNQYAVANGKVYDDYSKIPEGDRGGVRMGGTMTDSNRPDGAFAMADSEHHSAEIVTGPSFGCIHHEAHP
jgi:hypothetical protein